MTPEFWSEDTVFAANCFGETKIYPYYRWTSLHLIQLAWDNDNGIQIWKSGNFSLMRKHSQLSSLRELFCRRLLWLHTNSYPKKFPQRRHLRRFFFESEILAKSNGRKWLDKMRKKEQNLQKACKMMFSWKKTWISSLAIGCCFGGKRTDIPNILGKQWSLDSLSFPQCVSDFCRQRRKKQHPTTKVLRTEILIVLWTAFAEMNMVRFS